MTVHIRLHVNNGFTQIPSPRRCGLDPSIARRRPIPVLSSRRALSTTGLMSRRGKAAHAEYGYIMARNALLRAIHTADWGDSRCDSTHGEVNCGTMITQFAAALFEYWGAQPYLRSISGPFLTERPQPPLVVLVHGWRGNCGTFENLPQLIGQEIARRGLDSTKSGVKCEEYKWRDGTVLKRD